MDLRVGTILSSVIVIICLLSNARRLMASDITVTSMEQLSDGEHFKGVSRNEQMCTYCEEYTAQILKYLNSSQTQSNIISILDQACSNLHSLKHQCVSLVDYYVPLLFMEIAKIQPELFCEEASLCELVLIRIEKRDDACMICESLLSEVLTKLQDPDTELDIIQTLLKVCNKVENFVQECKKLVFEFGPLILTNAEKFLETTDICVAAHICKARQEAVNIRELLSSSA